MGEEGGNSRSERDENIASPSRVMSTFRSVDRVGDDDAANGGLASTPPSLPNVMFAFFSLLTHSREGAEVRHARFARRDDGFVSRVKDCSRDPRLHRRVARNLALDAVRRVEPHGLGDLRGELLRGAVRGDCALHQLGRGLVQHGLDLRRGEARGGVREWRRGLRRRRRRGRRDFAPSIARTDPPCAVVHLWYPIPARSPSLNAAMSSPNFTPESASVR